MAHTLTSNWAACGRGHSRLKQGCVRWRRVEACPRWVAAELEVGWCLAVAGRVIAAWIASRCLGIDEPAS